MLTLFENHTKPLNQYERLILLPLVMKGLKQHIGRDQAIKSDVIVRKLNEAGYRINGVRLRKIIHFIRENALLVCVMGDANGYYISIDKNDIEKQIESLKGRELSIRQVRTKLEENLKQLN